MAKTRLLREAQPTTRQDSQIEAMERRLRKKPDCMTLEEYASWLRVQLPGHVHGYAPSLPADEPTDAIPGSEEKIEVMTLRAARGRSLFHRRDRTLGRPE